MVYRRKRRARTKRYRRRTTRPRKMYRRTGRRRYGKRRVHRGKRQSALQFMKKGKSKTFLPKSPQWAKIPFGAMPSSQVVNLWWVGTDELFSGNNDTLNAPNGIFHSSYLDSVKTGQNLLKYQIALNDPFDPNQSLIDTWNNSAVGFLLYSKFYRYCSTLKARATITITQLQDANFERRGGLTDVITVNNTAYGGGPPTVGWSSEPIIAGFGVDRAMDTSIADVNINNWVEMNQRPGFHVQEITWGNPGKKWTFHVKWDVKSFVSDDMTSQDHKKNICQSTSAKMDFPVKLWCFMQNKNISQAPSRGTLPECRVEYAVRYKVKFFRPLDTAEREAQYNPFQAYVSGH